MSHLHLSFLGHPEVRHGERPVTFRTRKALALLIYLALEREQHSREKLTAFFWPESDQESGRATLRSTLVYLRKALEHANEEFPAHLLVSREAIGFDPGSVYTLDCETLSHLVRSADELADQTVSELLDLYRADFLEGFTLPDAPAFDDWAAVRREQYHLQMNELFDRSSQIAAAAGATPEALQLVNRWLALDPLQEAAYRRLIRLHLAAGDRAAAQRAYERCRRRLQEELGIEPSPATLALAEQISLGGRKGEGIERGTLPFSHSFDPSLPFVGRADEHTQLVTAYHTARQEHIQIVVIEGEAGIGKTRLAHEFLSWAAAQGADVLSGQSFETGGRLPYQPIVAALRDRVERENAPEDLLADVWLSELSRLLPELRDRYPDLPAPLAGETVAPSRLFEAVTRLVRVLAGRKPVILFVDDIQWADSASLDLLAYAVRGWQEDAIPFLLLLTLRAEALVEVPGSMTVPAVSRWLQALARQLGTKRLRLTALTAEATGEMVQKMSREQKKISSGSSAIRPSVVFADWLFGETQGQPLFITETLKNLIDEGILVRRGDEWDLPAALQKVQETAGKPYIPPGIREIVQNRLSRLSPAAFHCLAAAAALGQPPSFKQLCQVAGVKPDDGLGALDELLNVRLLTTTDERYHFTHDKIRDVVYAEAGSARRQLLHERAFTTLRDAGAMPAQLAHHAQIAGLESEAFTYTLAAGDEAMRLFAIKEAIRYYEQVQLAGRQLNVTSQQWQHLYLQLGRAYELDNAWDKAQVTYQTMRRQAQEMKTPALEITALNRLATVILHASFDGEQAAALLHEAERLAAQHNDKLGLAETEWNLSHLSIYTLDRQAAIEHGKRALTLARQSEQSELIARSLNALAYAENGLPERLPAIQAYMEEAQNLYAELGNQPMETDCLAGVGMCKIHLGQTASGIADLRQALEMSQAIENAWGQINCALHLAFGLVESGQYGEALAVINAGVSIARSHEFSGLLAHALSIRGNVYRAMRLLPQALDDHREAQTIFGRLPAPDVKPFLAVHLCADYALQEAWQDALPHARLAADSDQHTWLFSWLDAGFSYWSVIETLLQAGDEERARPATRSFGQLVGNNPRSQIPYLRCLAVLAKWEGDTAGSVVHLKTALTLARNLNLPGEQWPILAKLAQVESERGNKEMAASHRQLALNIIHFIADQIDDPALRQEFWEGTAVRAEPNEISIGIE